MVTSSKGMVQVAGTTYRIVQRAESHEVVRVLDDLVVGTFRHRPALRIMDSRIQPEMLLDIAKQALRSARLAWLPNTGERRSRLGSWLGDVVARWNNWIARLGWLVAVSARLQPVEMLSRSPRAERPRQRGAR